MKNKPKTKKLRYYTVYYTPLPFQHELVVKAESLEDAVAKVRDVLNEEQATVEGGCEVSSPENQEKKIKEIQAWTRSQERKRKGR